MANSKKLTPSNLAAHVQQRLASLGTSGRHLTLALSGGVDSVVLLDLLSKLSSALGYSLSTVHINHQISPNASDWADFCSRLCVEKKIPIQIKKVRVARRSGRGLEAAARAARYRAFAELESDFLLLAHHLDDQVETLLQNLLRGSGLLGASGMPEMRLQALQRQGHHITLFRPLLEIPRALLLAYAQQHNLRWIEDESNTDTAFGRNYLRHEVLPVIEQRFPAYRETLSRAAQHFAEADSLLDTYAQLDLANAMRAQKLHLRTLMTFSSARAMHVLRAYLKLQGVPALDSERLQEWIRQLLGARGDRQVDLGVAGLRLHRFRGEAWVEQDRPGLDPGWTQQWDGEPHLKLGALDLSLSFQATQGSGISLAKLTRDVVTIRLRQGGEKLQPSCARPRRSLKHLLQEAAIPPWRRKYLPIIFSGEQLVAVADIGVDCAFQAEPGEPGLLPHWVNSDSLSDLP